MAAFGPWFAIWNYNFPLHFAILVRQLQHFSIVSLFSCCDHMAVSSEASHLMSKMSLIGCPAATGLGFCLGSSCCRCCSTFDAFIAMDSRMFYCSFWQDLWKRADFCSWEQLWHRMDKLWSHFDSNSCSINALSLTVYCVIWYMLLGATGLTFLNSAVALAD